VGLSLYGIFGFFDVVSDGIDLGLSYGLVAGNVVMGLCI
jgi:hypothetical protein